MLFLMVVLKIPVVALLGIIWWAVKAVPDADGVADDDGHGFRRWRAQPRRPGGPRRGPHAPDALALPDCPPGGRFRTVEPSGRPVTASRR